MSFQAWYEARHGRGGVRRDRPDRAHGLGRLSELVQALSRHQPALPDARCDRIEPVGDHFRLHLDTPGGATTETARKIILATGFAGGGGRFIPDVLTAHLPPRRYAHTEDAIDFAALRGKTVGVIGAAAAAFDAAGVALEHGAAAVHLFARRDTIAAMPITRSRGFPGAYDNYHQLPDADRWHQAIRFFRAGSTPTTDAIERTVRFPNFHLHLSAPWTGAVERDGKIEATINGTTYRLDFVIAGTGYSGALAARTELRDFAGEILCWGDQYTPPPDEQDEMLAGYPYLGAGHELRPCTLGRVTVTAAHPCAEPGGVCRARTADRRCAEHEARHSGDRRPDQRRSVPGRSGGAASQRMTSDVAPDFSDELYRAAVR